MARVITEDRRWSEQQVVMLSPSVDDRIRALAQRHGCSASKAHRVALQCSLRGAEMLDAEAFAKVHAALEQEARRRHLDCVGGFHDLDSSH